MALNIGDLQVGTSGWTKPQGWTQADFEEARKQGYQYGSIPMDQLMGSMSGGRIIGWERPTSIPGHNRGNAIPLPRPIYEKPMDRSTTQSPQANMGWFKMPPAPTTNMPTIPPMPTMPPIKTPEVPAPDTGGGPGPVLDPQQVPVRPPEVPKRPMGGLMGAMSGPGFAPAEKVSSDQTQLGKRILPEPGRALTQKGNRVWR